MVQQKFAAPPRANEQMGAANYCYTIICQTIFVIKEKYLHLFQNTIKPYFSKKYSSEIKIKLSCIFFHFEV